MKVICEQRTWRAMSDSLTIGQSDDAWHPLEERNYIEWWYFDVMTGDGSVVRGQFHISGDVSRPGRVRTGVRASYVKPDGTEILIEEKFPYSAFKSSAEACDVEIGRSFLKADLSHSKLHIEDAHKALDLELDSEMRGIRSRACFGDETKYMSWVVPQPRARARGAFVTKDRTFDIEGLGYRDHNWLNFSPMDVMAYWDWGRVHDEQFSIIFADIVMTSRFENAEIKPLMVYDSGRLLYLTTEPGKWSLTKTGTKVDPDTHVALPKAHLVKAQDEDLSLEMNLHLERVFQRIDLLADFNPLTRLLIRTFKARPTITSFLSVGPGRLSVSGLQSSLTCTAVHEHVQST